MTRKAFTAAGVRLLFTCDEPIADAEPFPLFRTDEALPPDFTVHIKRGPLPPPEGAALLRTPHRLILQNGGVRTEFTFFSDSAHPERRPYACAALRGNEVELTVDRPGELWDTMLFDAIGLPDLFLTRGTPIVHASFIGDGAAGILFAGPKQQGKTTQALLWNAHRHADLINGDRAAVRETPEGFFACGVPFCGTSRISRNETRKLAAIVFPEKSTENRAVRLTPFESFKRLIGCFSYTEAVPAARDAALRLAERIAEQNACYLLQCRPEPAAAETLAAALGLPPCGRP